MRVPSSRFTALMDCLLLLLIIAVSALAQHSDNHDVTKLAAPRLPSDNLLVYRAADKKFLPVTEIDQWLKRREEIVCGDVRHNGHAAQSRKGVQSRPEDRIGNRLWQLRAAVHYVRFGNRLPNSGFSADS